MYEYLTGEVVGCIGDSPFFVPIDGVIVAWSHGFWWCLEKQLELHYYRADLHLAPYGTT